MGGIQGWKMVVFIVLLVGVILFPPAVRAEKEGKLDLKTTVAKEVKVKKNGQAVMELVAADQSAPGDALLFTITYTNVGGSAVTNAVIVNPVPPGLVLQPESAAGQDAAVRCSIDSGTTFHAPPIMERVKKADGTESVQAVPAARYTHVKWSMNKPVTPGQSGRVSFKATVK